MTIESRYKLMAISNATNEMAILNELGALVLERIDETEKCGLSCFNLIERRMLAIMNELEKQVGILEENK